MIFIIGYSSGVVEEELDAIAGGRGKSYSVRSFDELLQGQLVPQLKQRLCKNGMNGSKYLV